VSEARHRTREGHDSVGSAEASERSVEHLEFRRHVLKRFTASVLWLSLEVRAGAQWLVHTLYAIAAALAMSFALFASFQTTTPTSENIFRYAVLVVIAYAVKDRLKAFLQNVFADLVAKRLPDRKWTIRDRERSHDVGRVLERAAFLPFRSLPAAVLERRRVTREHALEEFARPERVLWHQKTITVAGAKRGSDIAEFPMLTEIFRLNLRRWLMHTDDPNRKIVFADPGDARVYSATARRVYNINVVYRLCPRGIDAPWNRLRVVVSRKGIERIEPIR
jgi:Lon protease-like protein